MPRLLKKLPSRAGFTVIEVLTASMVFSLIAMGGLSMLVGGVNSYQRDFSRASMDSDAAQAMRRVVDALRPAVDVTVAADGQNIVFSYPRLDANGVPLYPIQSDGIMRMIWRESSRPNVLWFRDPARSTTQEVMNDLRPPSTTNRLFAMHTGNRAVMVSLSSQRSTGTEIFRVHKTELVKLRNVR